MLKSVHSNLPEDIMSEINVGSPVTLSWKARAERLLTQEHVLGVAVLGDTLSICLTRKNRKGHRTALFTLEKSSRYDLLEIKNGRLHSHSALVALLKSLRKQFFVKNPRIVLSVSDEWVTIKRIFPPKMSEKELRSFLPANMHSYMDLPLGRFFFDAEIINPNAGRDQLDALLVVCPHKWIKAWNAAFVAAGFHGIDAVEHHAWPLRRLLRSAHSAGLLSNENPSTFDDPDEEDDGVSVHRVVPVALLHVGEEQMSLTIFAGDHLIFNQDFNCGLSWVETGTMNPTLIPKIKKALDFYVGTTMAPGPHKVWVLGEGANVSVFRNLLYQRLNHEAIDRRDLFDCAVESMPIYPQIPPGVSIVETSNQMRRAAVAIGASLRDF